MNEREIKGLYLMLNEMSVEELEKAINDSLNIPDSKGNPVSPMDFIECERHVIIEQYKFYFCQLDEILDELQRLRRDNPDSYYNEGVQSTERQIFKLKKDCNNNLEQLYLAQERLNSLRNSSSDLFYIKSIGNSSVYYNPNAPEFLLKLCIKEIDKQKDEIKKIIHQNPQKIKYVLEVINLIAPAIAQSYKGFPALAIVGSIILLFKQCIFNFLDSDKEK